MKVLNTLGEKLSHQFLRDFGDAGCTCFISPPCAYCTHEGHPEALAASDDVWMDVWDLDEAVDQAKTAVRQAIDTCAAKHLLEMAKRGGAV